MEGAINAACAHVPSIRLCTAGREGYQLLLDQLEKEMIDDWDRVERVVKELLEDLSGRPRSDIGLEDTLLLDLGVTGDDISFVFIPETARLLGLTPTRSAWESVWTVRDAIQALVSSADTSSSGNP